MQRIFLSPIFQLSSDLLRLELLEDKSHARLNVLCILLEMSEARFVRLFIGIYFAVFERIN